MAKKNILEDVPVGKKKKVDKHGKKTYQGGEEPEIPINRIWG